MLSKFVAYLQENENLIELERYKAAFTNYIEDVIARNRFKEGLCDAPLSNL